MADPNPGNSMSDEEKRRMEEEIEEILRKKGEQPSRARRPQHVRLTIPPVLVGLFKYLLVLAAMGLLLLVSVRVLGPRGLVFTFWALFIFFFFYAIRGFLQDIRRRRRR